VVLGLALAALLAWEVTTQPFVVPVPSQVPSPDEARMRSTVRQLSEALYPRSFDQPRKLAAAGRYVRDAFSAAGAKVEEQEVLVQGERFFNVVARFGPEQGPVLVVGAHYDSYGDAIAASRQGSMVRTRIRPVRTTMPAVSRRWSRSPISSLGAAGSSRGARRVHAGGAAALSNRTHGKLLACQGLVGSSRAVELMISLEMIGYFSDAEGSQSYPVPGLGLLYPTKGDFIAIVSRPQDWSETRRLKAAMMGASELPVYSINTLPLVPGVDFSDHRCYWEEGIAAVMVTDTAFNRNAAYHGAGDTSTGSTIAAWRGSSREYMPTSRNGHTAVEREAPCLTRRTSLCDIACFWVSWLPASSVRCSPA
jgi:hypothetical protein